MILHHWAASLGLYYAAYPALGSLFTRCSSTFQQLNDEKQAYVVSNTLKASVLCGLCLAHAGRLHDIVRYGVWDSVPLGTCAPWYAALDVVSLLRVRKMMRSTYVHHVLVGLCGIYVTTFPVEKATLSGHICVYALFSSLAFFVNGFLAARHVVADRNLKPVAKMCGIGYAGVCAAHWSFHARSIWQYPTPLCILPVLFGGFVYDDVVLMRWLMNYN